MYGRTGLRRIDGTERELASTWICGGGREEDANGFCFDDALCKEVVRDGRYGEIGSRAARQADWTQAKEHAQMGAVWRLDEWLLTRGCYQSLRILLIGLLRRWIVRE